MHVLCDSIMNVRSKSGNGITKSIELQIISCLDVPNLLAISTFIITFVYVLW